MVKIQIIGRLGRDCETNEFNGRTVINFNVASSERFKDSSGNMQERTTWVRCAYWTSSAGIAEYLKKGKLVYAEGTPSVSSFTRNDGTPGASLEMRVRRVELLGGKDDTGGSEFTPQQQEAGASTGSSVREDIQAPDSEDIEDDLPF